MAAGAQTSFTQRLQQSKPGEGRVTVTQDKAITSLVDAAPSATPAQKPAATPAQKPASRTDADKPDSRQQPAEERHPVVADNQPAAPDTTYVDMRKKVMRGYKVNGYRVQVFAGGNSRDARQKAERVGREINTLFPGEPVYVHFYSPRWICRMGNYRTYEEAHQTLNAVKKLGYKSAIIVKGKITVPYQPADDTSSQNP